MLMIVVVIIHCVIATTIVNVIHAKHSIYVLIILLSVNRAFQHDNHTQIVAINKNNI
jgi:hypothetical protein